MASISLWLRKLPYPLNCLNLNNDSTKKGNYPAGVEVCKEEPVIGNPLNDMSLSSAGAIFVGSCFSEGVAGHA